MEKCYLKRGFQEHNNESFFHYFLPFNADISKHEYVEKFKNENGQIVFILFHF